MTAERFEDPDGEDRCDFCGNLWDERHAKYGCPDEMEVRLSQEEGWEE